MGLLYDLHIHTALSPCADNDMTPATVVGLAKLNGLDLVAVTDHNSAANLPAAQAAARHYGIRLLPGIEVNTAEEIHILCYFPSVAAALEMSGAIYETLPKLKADPEIWGDQLILDENDAVTGSVDKLLTVASAMNLYEVAARCRVLGGIAVPAHADRDAYSVFSVLGMFPEDVRFEAAELRHPGNRERYTAQGLMPAGMEILFSSDAHHLSQLSEPRRYFELDDGSCLMPLIASLR